MKESHSLSMIAGLREIAQALSGANDLDSALNLIAQKTTKIMAVDSCSIYLLDLDGVNLRLMGSTGLRKQFLGYAQLKIGEGMTGSAVSLNQPIYAEIAREHPNFKSIDGSNEEEFVSLLAVPLVRSGIAIGGMNVQTTYPYSYSHDEVELLALISDLAAGALSKARLHDQQKAQLEELNALAQVSEMVTSPQYLNEMLDMVTDMAARTVNASVCSLFLIDETGEQLIVRSTRHVESGYDHRSPLPLRSGILGDVVQSGKSAYIANVLLDPRFANPEAAEKAGIHSMLAVPLTVRDHTIGVLVTYAKSAERFSEQQVPLLLTLANQTALAIENSRLVTNASIIREMHHRIKNNLQTVAMLMQLQIPDADRLDTKEVLETNIHRIRSIATVHDVLSEKGFRMVDVRDVLERIAYATAETVAVPNRTIDIIVSGDTISLPSRTATALALVVNELVQNGLDHAFEGRSVGKIVISLSRTAETILVWVRDDGVGIPDEIEQGLGLEIVETLVEDDLQGTIEFIRLEQGTEVMIRMPSSLESEHPL